MACAKAPRIILINLFALPSQFFELKELATKILRKKNMRLDLYDGFKTKILVRYCCVKGGVLGFVVGGALGPWVLLLHVLGILRWHCAACIGAQ